MSLKQRKTLKREHRKSLSDSKILKLEQLNIWLAPLHGITNHIFRNSLCRHFSGIDFFMTPFLPVQETAKLNVKNWQDIWPKNNTICPTILQLMGNKPAHFVDTMNVLNKAYGYTSFNWNIGCPVSQVVHRKRGCGIMPETDRVEEVVKLVTEETGYHFSIKMRLGLHQSEEGLRILERLQNYPLDFIVVHPRLGEQMYEGHTDLESFDTFYNYTNHKLIFSGDVFSVSDYQMLQQRYPKIQDWMLGRGLLRNPFLAEEIKSLPTGDKKQRFIKYYQLWINELLSYRKEHGTLYNLKELWHYYRFLVNLEDEELRQLLRIDDLDTFITCSLRYLER